MPHKDPTALALYMRELRQKAREKGFCDMCYREPATIAKKCEKCDKRTKKYRREIKLQAITNYGGKCVCCGESNIAFLTFDHVDSNGGERRKRIPEQKGGSAMHYWLRRNGYPNEFQILCYNCNLARDHNDGICPHKEG